MTSRRFTLAYPAELRERGVRLFRENRADDTSDSAAFRAIAPKLGCSPDSLRVCCQQAERDAGQRAGLTSAEKDRFKELERENREFRIANEILKKGETIFRHWSEDNGRRVFRGGRARPPVQDEGDQRPRAVEVGRAG